MSHSSKNPDFLGFLEEASSADLITILESVRNAIEDRRRKEEGTFVADEARLTSRLQELTAMLEDYDGPNVKAWQRFRDLSAEYVKAQETARICLAARNAAESEANTASQERKKVTRPWKRERISIEKQLASLLKDEKELLAPLAEDSDDSESSELPPRKLLTGKRKAAVLEAAD